MSSPGIEARARTALVFVVFVGIASICSATASAADDGYPAPVLRLRGGLVFPDPDYKPGPGWSAGGSIGYAVNRAVLLSLNYDHLYLDVPDTHTRTGVLDPVTLELELGRQAVHRFTPRISAGAGLYFHRDLYPDYRVVFFEPQRRSSLSQRFGMNFGAGGSIPVWRRTLMDFDVRYHQTVGQGSGSMVIGTASAGLRFLLPGPKPDPEGYVRTGIRGAVAYAANEIAP